MFVRQLNKSTLRVILATKRFNNNSTKPWIPNTEYISTAWGSDAEKRISEVPVIEVAARYAVCEGGSGSLGHPIQYIQLDRVNPEPAVCKYCGLRYKMGKMYNRYGKVMKFHAH